MKGKVLKGPIVDDNVQMGMGEYFWRTAEKYGNKVCQIHADTEEKQSFLQVKIRALRVAIELRKMGVRPKDVVMVCCQNDLDCIVPVLAALFLGAYVVSSIPFLDLYHNKYMILETKPKVIFVIGQQLRSVEQAIKKQVDKPQLIVVGQSDCYPMMSAIENVYHEEEQLFVPFKVDVNDTAFILFSSGTSSRPKGICVSHFSALAGACRTYRCEENSVITEDTPFICFNTMYWISSVWLTAYSFLGAQTKIVAPTIGAEKCYEMIDKYKVKHLFLCYSLLAGMTEIREAVLLKYDRSSVKYISSGGAFIDPKFLVQLRALFPKAFVVQSYGSTEMGTSPTTWDRCDKESYSNKLASVGTAGVNIEIKIVDTSTRDALNPNQIGEITVKSPYKMNKYFLQTNHDLLDKDDFLRTGDLGYYDEEGYVFLVDRQSDVFKRKYICIYPHEVESTLRNHPSVKEAVVFGQYHPVDLNIVVACVVLKTDFEATAEEISLFVVKNMSELHRPVVKFFDCFPLTDNGKICRREVKRIFFAERESNKG